MGDLVTGLTIQNNSGSQCELFDIRIMQIPAIGGFPLELVIGVISIITFFVIVYLYRMKVHIPRQAAKKLEVTKRFIENAKEQAGTESYVVEENTPLWYIATIFASHAKKGGAKKPLQPILEQLVEKEFPEKFDKEAEKTLLGMCQELAEHNYMVLLSILSSEIMKKIGNQKFQLKLEDSELKIRCWGLMTLLSKKPELRGDLRKKLEITDLPIRELQTKSHLREKFIPILTKVLVESWEAAPWLTEWLTKVFRPLNLDYKMYFLKELNEISKSQISYKRTPLLDAIVRTITLKSIIELPEQEWGGYFEGIVNLGYRKQLPPLDLEGLAEIDYTKRYEVASTLIISKFQVEMDAMISKLLNIEESERVSFFDFDVPEVVSDYCYDKGWDSYPYMKYNQRAILDVIRRFQQHGGSGSGQGRFTKSSTQTGMSIDNFISFIQGIPDDIIAKIRENPGTQSILRYTMGNILADRLRSSNYEIAAVLKLYGPPYDDIVDIVGANINTTILKSGNDRNLQECLLTLQAALLESGTSNKKIKKISDWLKLWSSINEKTAGAKEDHEYASKLLDVIEETKGELEPLFIAQHALSLIGPDLEKSIMIFRNIDPSKFNQRMYETRVEESRKKLESVKQAYYKLQLLSKNQSLNITNDVREAFVQISEEILGFVVRCRREDFLERMQHFPLEFAAVLDPGALVKTTVERAAFVYLPPAYQPFPLPALRVLNEFLNEPRSIPYSGNKMHGIVVSPSYWVFAIAVGLTLQPVIAFAEQTYSNFFVPEYLKTAALAFKKGESAIEKLLRRVIPDFVNLDSSNLLITLFKQLTDHHFFQGVITREFIIDALKFGEWDISLADKIIEEKEYCVYCSFALPDGATVCPNCERRVQKIDLSTLTPEDIEIDLDAITGGFADGGTSTTDDKEEGT